MTGGSLWLRAVPDQQTGALQVGIGLTDDTGRRSVLVLTKWAAAVLALALLNETIVAAWGSMLVRMRRLAFRLVGEA